MPRSEASAKAKKICDGCKQEIEVQSMPKHRQRCAKIIQREVKAALEAVVQRVEAPGRKGTKKRSHALVAASPPSPDRNQVRHTKPFSQRPSHRTVLSAWQRVKWEATSLLMPGTPAAAAAASAHTTTLHQLTPPAAALPAPPPSPLGQLAFGMAAQAQAAQLFALQVHLQAMQTQAAQLKAAQTEAEAQAARAQAEVQAAQAQAQAAQAAEREAVEAREAAEAEAAFFINECVDGGGVEHPVNGVSIYRSAVDLVPIQRALPELRERADKGDAIQAGQSDDKRRQVRVDPSEELAKELLKVLSNKGELRRRKPGEMNALHSRTRCKEQKRHWDYNPDEIEGRRGRKPASVILALERGARIIFFSDELNARSERVPVLLEPGDVLVFDGDVSHAGAAYCDPNTRVHVYLDIEGVERVKDYTWFVRRAG